MTTSLSVLADDALRAVRPAMRADGGDVEVVGVADNGQVSVRMCGTCVACPSKELTLKHGIEKTLRERYPWVTGVVCVD